jgi:hypothetical protein
MEPQMTPIIPIAQVLISFAGYQFLAVRLPDGRIAIVFRHLCESLNLSRPPQVERIKANPTLAKNFLLVRIQTPGGPQDVNALVVSALSLWLGGFDLTRLSEEKCRLIILLQEDAEEAFSRPFVVTPLEPPQQPKAPPPPPLQFNQVPLSVYDLHRALVSRMEQEAQELLARLTRAEQENLRLAEQLSRVLEDYRRLELWITNIDRQQMNQVAWMAERGHGMDVQAQQITSLTVRVDHLESAGPPAADGRMPRPTPERLRALKTMPYPQYLQTPEWKAYREVALRRAWYRCQMCESDQTPLYVHHRTYKRRGEEVPEDLCVLCRSCHALFDPQFAAKWQQQTGKAVPPASAPDGGFDSEM